MRTLLLWIGGFTLKKANLSLREPSSKVERLQGSGLKPFCLKIKGAYLDTHTLPRKIERHRWKPVQQIASYKRLEQGGNTPVPGKERCKGNLQSGRDVDHKTPPPPLQ